MLKFIYGRLHVLFLVFKFNTDYYEFLINFYNMKRTYSLFQEYISYGLLVSLLLQSCGGFNNTIIPTDEEHAESIQTNTQAILPRYEDYEEEPYEDYEEESYEDYGLSARDLAIYKLDSDESDWTNLHEALKTVILMRLITY